MSSCVLPHGIEQNETEHLLHVYGALYPHTLQSFRRGFTLGAADMSSKNTIPCGRCFPPRSESNIACSGLLCLATPLRRARFPRASPRVELRRRLDGVRTGITTSSSSPSKSDTDSSDGAASSSRRANCAACAVAIALSSTSRTRDESFRRRPDERRPPGMSAA